MADRSRSWGKVLQMYLINCSLIMMSVSVYISTILQPTSKYNNKTNHLVSSNSHPSATANKAIHCLKGWNGGRGGGARVYKTNGNIIKFWRSMKRCINEYLGICIIAYQRGYILKEIQNDRIRKSVLIPQISKDIFKASAFSGVVVLE